MDWKPQNSVLVLFRQELPVCEESEQILLGGPVWPADRSHESICDRAGRTGKQTRKPFREMTVETVRKMVLKMSRAVGWSTSCRQLDI